MENMEQISCQPDWNQLKIKAIIVIDLESRLIFHSKNPNYLVYREIDDQSIPKLQERYEKDKNFRFKIDHLR